MAENVKVGIIGAMDSEVALLKSRVEGEQTHELAGLEFVEGMLEGVSVVVVKCGVGKVNAAMCAQALVSVLGCNRIINTGVAGSLDNRIEIGDIVVSTDAVEHDMDVTALGYAPGEHPDLHLVAFEADTALRSAVVVAAGELDGVNVFEGRVCSGDQFIGSAAAKERIVSTFGGMCCEMEGAAIAHACHVAGVPFVVVRAISDKADDSGNVDYPTFEKAAAAHCASIVLAALPRVA
ncbi:5'-methylthioadenosine/adenosylhomocysteine nucleosidase [uncultured Parolsenella sp.]|uniref:5'-methylthioadenosine/adenosylhomocysteine nucleosidase n=1 Tax=uncultured Parolsenella sp. TaxID=2083008 RepID=UPI0027DE53B7|nr:5'-methylthioadenosine/adenosylhomocysteine nucleosidase [uncultured Parolsenella sp.]